MKYEALSICTSEAQVARVAGHQVCMLGFDYWIYSAMFLQGSSQSTDWSIHNFPYDLYRAYAGIDCEAGDAIAERSKRHMIPRVWLLQDGGEAPSGPGTHNDPLHAAARKHGVLGGLCLPVHDVAGVVATLTLATCQPVSIGSLEAASTQALLFSKYLHEACRPYVLQAQRGTAPGLSPRELECLRWASKGKTAWEIGRVLGISEHTAIFHLRNASTKLGTANRQQAVAKSIQLGFVAA